MRNGVTGGTGNVAVAGQYLIIKQKLAEGCAFFIERSEIRGGDRRWQIKAGGLIRVGNRRAKEDTDSDERASFETGSLYHGAEYCA